MIGDFTPGQVVPFKFNTHLADGTPATLAGTPAVKVYRRGSTTESAAGVTLAVDYDAVTGLHDVAIDTSADATFYAAGNDYAAVLTAGSVDGKSVVGTVVGSFSLDNRTVAAVRAQTDKIGTDAGDSVNLQGAIIDVAGLPDADTIATQVELQIMDEGDSRAVLQAIVNKINAADPDLSGLTLTAIAQTVWANATRTLTALPALPNVVVGDLTQAALAKFATTDTGRTSAAAGSVAKLAQGAGGGGDTYVIEGDQVVIE